MRCQRGAEDASTGSGNPHVVPLPLSVKTLTAMMVAFLATPWIIPAATPATAVPWPLPSVVLLSTVLIPGITRPESC